MVQDVVSFSDMKKAISNEELITKLGDLSEDEILILYYDALDVHLETKDKVVRHKRVLDSLIAEIRSDHDGPLWKIDDQIEKDPKVYEHKNQLDIFEFEARQAWYRILKIRTFMRLKYRAGYSKIDDLFGEEEQIKSDEKQLLNYFRAEKVQSGTDPKFNYEKYHSGRDWFKTLSDDHKKIVVDNYSKRSGYPDIWKTLAYADFEKGLLIL